MCFFICPVCFNSRSSGNVGKGQKTSAGFKPRTPGLKSCMQTIRPTLHPLSQGTRPYDQLELAGQERQPARRSRLFRAHMCAPVPPLVAERPHKASRHLLQMTVCLASSLSLFVV